LFVPGFVAACCCASICLDLGWGHVVVDAVDLHRARVGFVLREWTW